ncbi:NADPH-dependent FMN reductase [Pseudalkalibacillus hwajinpoensis]|uniref:NAD(P)H-dependent oxidoreductase n=1 Tax=Guptibacillus hwajinpoensis TaxID=208199 RepID=A0A4U1MEJ5_9BACL|nr:NAD(P)H-dependent oxidoreductase [Pseudalkalibacillus hwajinpoensis]TKD69233.1 NAD(P)H-dependent oxidoreductase [Pseudalkalibacillus hwajinpoensis]
MTNILIVNGSPRKNSRTKSVVKKLIKIHSKLNFNVDLSIINLDELKLPLFDGETKTIENKNVDFLKDKFNKADGYIICTPEYHNGMSGALKNALDFLGKPSFKTKPATIIGVSGTPRTGFNALNQLRVVGRGLGVLVLSNQTIVDPSAFNEDREIVDFEVEKDLQLLMEETIKYTNLLNSKSLV